MHERICDQFYSKRHMWPVPYSTTVTAEFSSNPATIATSDSFHKDGREIHIGDCALFKPPQDSPPFIGIILKLIVGNKEELRLGVNWLYRPTDVKLAKGNSPFQAAPNEIFYSFHKDETPVASLLHPCKVAFLRKGVELPPRTFSFVCRRVYDIENRCLWWLTDKDYLNERQEEVNYLLDRTKQAMHGAIQPGGRSPRSFNGIVITQPLKPSVDNNNNNNNSSTSNSTLPLIPEAKNKRRERIVEQGSDPIKRDRFLKSDDGDSSILRRSESMLKSEIAKITVRGGLVELDSVDRLVNLIKTDPCADCTEKKIDLVGRVMLVNVIAFTDRFDCLARFVQLKGLPVLDEWLQEVHKGKNGGCNSPKENERNVDDFLLVLLRALDKLPVNLDALQTCNVGKSVNHLRTHKNSEIQRKARSLVDTWKKRVEAEMNMIDAKSASSRSVVTWPSKSINSESSPVNKRVGVAVAGGSCDFASKVPTVPASVTSGSPSIKQNNTLEVLNNRVSSSASPSSVKSPLHNSKEQTTRGIPCGGASDISRVAVKEEKSSNSSNSHNNSHSCSSEHAKASKDDAKNSTAISGDSNRISGISSRHRKPSNGFSASPGTPLLKENMFLPNHGSYNRNMFSAKVSPSRSTPEKVSRDFNNNHSNPRLLVRLPNTITRSAPFSPTVNDASLEYTNVFSRDDLDDKSRAIAAETSDSNINVEVPDTNGKIDMPIDEHHIPPPERAKHIVTPTVREGRASDTAFNPMNTLAESCEKLTDSLKVLIHCTKFSEMDLAASRCNGDDIGMNLLATVAAGEISRTDNGSPVCSIGGNAPPSEETDDTLPHKDDVGAHDVGAAVKEESSLSFDEQGVQSKPDCSSIDPSSLPNQACSHNLQPLPSNHAISPGSPIRVESTAPGGSTESHEVKEAAVDSHCSSSCKQESENLENDLLSQSDPCLPPPQTPPFTRSFSGIDAKIMADVLSSEQGNIDSKSDHLPVLDHFDKAESLSNNSESNKDHVEDSTKRNILEEHSGHEESSGSKAGDVLDRSNAPTSSSNPTSLLTSGSDAAFKLDFDLNEGLSGEDGYHDELGLQNLAADSTVLPLPGNQQLNHLPSFVGGFSGSVTVAAAAKGPFFLPENPSKSGVELGWKGSAATSAFRPAEPRKNVELSLSSPDGPPSITASPKPARCPLNIDLNVADERVFEDFFPQKSRVASSESAGQNCGSGCLDLDLNRTDDSLEAVNFCSNFSNLQASSSSRRRFPSVYSNGDFMDSSHCFDLNNGPGPEEAASEGTHHPHNSSRNTNLLPFSLSPPVRISGSSDYSTFSPWYPPGNSYSAITIPSILQARGDHGYPLATISGSVAPPAVHRGLGHPTGSNVSFTPDMYRGTVISSSPAMPFPSSPSFQYSGFPFETGSAAYGDALPGGSGTLCFPAIPSQIMGVMPTHFSRPSFMVGIPGGMGGSSSENRKWGNGVLDLNCGPDVERREERCLLQQQGLTEEQMKVYQVGVKRKDPDGGWERMDRAFQKQQHMSWR